MYIHLCREFINRKTLSIPRHPLQPFKLNYNPYIKKNISEIDHSLEQCLTLHLGQEANINGLLAGS